LEQELLGVIMPPEQSASSLAIPLGQMVIDKLFVQLVKIQ
jgi:hypothetical protein